MGKTYTFALKGDTLAKLKAVRGDYTLAMNLRETASWDDTFFTLAELFQKSGFAKQAAVQRAAGAELVEELTENTEGAADHE